MTATTAADDVFAQWCIVELLGHRRLAGHIREVQLAGAGFLRLDIPATGSNPAVTQYVAPGSVYALHPVDETTARAFTARYRHEPVHRWEIAALLPDSEPHHPGQAGDDAWDDGDGPTGDGDADLRAAASDTGGGSM